MTVGQATGAGGANVWTSAQLRDALTGTDFQFDPLPAGVGFSLAIRRAIRSAAGDGIPIEDLGHRGHAVRHDPSRPAALQPRPDQALHRRPRQASNQPTNYDNAQTRSTHMASYDPGPPAALTAHFAALPSYGAHRVELLVRLGPDLLPRPAGQERQAARASPPTPARPSGSPAAPSSATPGQRVQGFLTKLGLTESYCLVNAFPYALLPVARRRRHRDAVGAGPPGLAQQAAQQRGRAQAAGRRRVRRAGPGRRRALVDDARTCR